MNFFSKSRWIWAAALCLGCNFAPPLLVPAAEGPALFLAEASAKADAAAKANTMTIRGKDGWLFFGPELRHLSVGKFWGPEAAKVSRAASTNQADPLPVILDFQAQLNRAGIDLVLVPVPPKAVVYPEFLSDTVSAGAERVDTQHQEFYNQLRQHGVKVLDLWSVFASAQAKKTNASYCKQDTHWSGQGCVLAAQLIAQELQTRPWFASIPKQTFASEWRAVEITGDLWRELKVDAPAKESVPLRFVGSAADSKLKAVPADAASPVVLLGDSHNLIFHQGDDMQAVGAGLPDQLALELGFAVDVVAVRGSGATPARINLARKEKKPGYLSGKKAIIWCFTAREFTESDGWRKVPIVKP